MFKISRLTGAAKKQISLLVPSISPAGTGVILLVLTAPVHLVLDHSSSVVVSALILALVGGAYIGFGAADGRPTVFWSELLVASLFGLTAALGILWHWSALPIGLALHAGWDLLHHNSKNLAVVPNWYVPFCVVYDLLAAAYFFALYGFFM